MSISRSLFVLVVSGAAGTSGLGCEQWRAPERVKELEARVDELSASVSALTGKPVGAPKKKDGEEGDEHAKDDKEDKKGAKDKDSEKSKDKDQEGEHDKVAKDEHGKSEEDHGQDADAPPMDRSKDKDKDAEHDKDKDKEKDKEAKVEDKPKKAAHDAHFAYEGKDGPKEWGELDPAWETCGTGKQQSPIEISPRAGKASPIEFHYKPTPGTVIDNGHTLQVNLSPGSTIDIDQHIYQLVQFHIHTPSEHVIAGEHYPMELHLVHKDEDGKLAVIGVMYDLGAESKPLGQVWSSWPKKPNVESKLKKPFDPSKLLPDTRTVFRYEGSLTTPPCTEGVLWNVMRRTMTESKTDLDLIGLRLSANARPTQPINDRKVE